MAILAAAGCNGAELSGMKSALEAAGIKAEVVAPLLGQLRSADGQEIKVDKTFATSGSVLYEAVCVPGGAAGVAALVQQGDALHVGNEAFKHGKAIAALSEGVELLRGSDVNVAGTGRPDGAAAESQTLPPDPAVVTTDQPGDVANIGQQFLAAIGQQRNFARQNTARVPA